MPLSCDERVRSACEGERKRERGSGRKSDERLGSLTREREEEEERKRRRKGSSEG